MELIDLLKHAVAEGVSFTELVNQAQGNTQVATTPEEQSMGLRNQPPGTSMVFPNSAGDFTTKGMSYNIDIQKYDNDGHLVQSYRNVPPGVESLPMGNKSGTVIETPSEYHMGGELGHQHMDVADAYNTLTQPQQRTKAGQKITQFTNLFRKDENKKDPYIKDHGITEDDWDSLWGLTGQNENNVTPVRGEFEASDGTMHTYSNRKDVYDLVDKGIMDQDEALIALQSRKNVTHLYQEQIDFARNYMNSDAYLSRLNETYDDPESVRRLRLKALDNLVVYGENVPTLMQLDRIKTSDKKFRGAWDALGGSHAFPTEDRIVMRSDNRQTFAHELGHIVGGAFPSRSDVSDMNLQLSYGDWKNLTLDNRYWQQLDWMEDRSNLPQIRGDEIVEGQRIFGTHDAENAGYWMPTGETVPLTYERVNKSDRGMIYGNLLMPRHQRNSDRVMEYGGYDGLLALEQDWENAKPGSRKREKIEAKMRELIVSEDRLGYNIPEDHPEFEYAQEVSNTSSEEFADSYIHSLSRNHIINSYLQDENNHHRDHEGKIWVNMEGLSSHLKELGYKDSVKHLEAVSKNKNGYHWMFSKDNTGGGTSSYDADDNLEFYDNEAMGLPEGTNILIKSNNRYNESSMRAILKPSGYQTRDRNRWGEFNKVIMDDVKWQINDEGRGTPTGEMAPGMGMKDYTEEGGYDFAHRGGAAEVYSDIWAMRQWVNDNVGIGPEKNWTEEDWNMILEEYDRQVEKRGKRGRILGMERLFLQFGREWNDGKGPAGKHNTTAFNNTEDYQSVDEYINNIRYS